MEHPVILFDGVCNLCNDVVRFLIRNDKKKRLRFAALQSEAGVKLLVAAGLPPSYQQSFVFLKQRKLYTQSSGALKVFQELPWYWQWTQVFWLVPPFIRNGIYNFIGKKRYQWFGKKDRCAIPAPDTRSRFLD